MLATMLNVDPACGLVNVVNVDVWSWVVRRKCKNLAILSDFKRFWTIFGRFGTIWDHFPACFAISRGSSIAGRVTTANVDNMLSAEPSKCWNMLNVDWTCKCCVPHMLNIFPQAYSPLGSRFFTNMAQISFVLRVGFLSSFVVGEMVIFE